MQAKVMVVEDEAIVACDIESRLRRAGYDVAAVAASATEALAKIEETSPDLVLMDICLQGPRDGISVASEIRDRFRLPVIYLTAHADRFTVERAKVTGPFSYLVKPIGSLALWAAIEVALHKHRSEQESLEREAWFTTVFDSVADGMVVTDSRGRIQFVNPSAERMIGCERAEVVGRPVADVVCLMDAADRSIASDLLRKAILDGNGTELPRDVRLIPRRGRSLQVEGQIAVGRTMDRGTAAGSIMVLRDVTTRKNEEMEISQEQKMLAAGQLAGGIAGDFRKLLSAILGNCHELLQKTEEGGAQRDRIQAIQDAGEAASALTEQLEELWRNQLICRRSIDLNAAVTELLPVLKQLAGPSVEVSTNLAPDAGKIRADPAQIEQVLVNLILSARDAMRGRGSVTIHTEKVDLPPRNAIETGPEPFVRLAVSDTGAGIEADVVEDVLEPFADTDVGRNSARLGLAIVHAIVTSGDGLLNVDRRPGGGNLFEIFIPRLEEQSPGKTVLLIESRAEVRRTVRDSLEGGGYELLEAENPEEAAMIAMLHDSPIDVLIEGGPSAADSRKARYPFLEAREPTKVLYLLDKPDDGVLMVRSAANSVEKPLTREALLERLRQALN